MVFDGALAPVILAGLDDRLSPTGLTDKRQSVAAPREVKFASLRLSPI